MKKAIVLISGGLDSTTCLAYAKSKGFQCYALSFNYTKKLPAELLAARKLAQAFGVIQHRVFDLPIDQFGGSALTDINIDVPEHVHASTDIPVTYVPARNTVFLAVALGWAEVLDAQDIFIGVSAVDYSGYPDCRPEYIKAFQAMANLATKAGIEGHGCRINTPLIHLSKAQTIKLGLELQVDYSETVTCYQADDLGRACGVCDSCFLRQQGFLEAKVADPTRYVNKREATAI